ncbi:MAG: DUF5012 domain-containing protein [Bacteroidetes bacterium]|nr:DUF5012 domain-containing protein [Bacteroidota bacterium]
MKKINKLIAILGVAVIFLVGCEKTTDNLSRVTNFPDFTMLGDAVIFHSLGDAFTDPGCTATEAGVDLTVAVDVSGRHSQYSGATVDVANADEYHITYSAVNADGFPGSVGRTVHVAKVGDLTTSIEGIYTADITRNGTTSAQYQGLAYVYIWKNTDGTFGISDGIGGYYAMGRGYGDNYKATGCIITANDIPTNDFTFGTFSVKTFGGVCEMTSMTVDAANKTIEFVTDWDAGYKFEVTLSQVQF